MLKLFQYLKPYRLFIFFVLLFLFLRTFADLFLPTLMARIVDNGIVNGDIPYILKIGGLMLFVAAIGVVCAISANYFAVKTATSFGRDLRRAVFSKVTNFSIQEFNQIGTSSFITRTTNDIQQMQQFVSMGLRMMVISPLMFVGGIIMAVSQDQKLSTIFLVIVPIIMMIIYFITKKGMPLFQELQKKLDHLSLILRENLTGIRVVRSFSRTDYETDRFDRASQTMRDIAIKVNRIVTSLMPIMMLIFNLSIVAILWFGSKRIDYGHMQVGSLMAFIQYAMQIMFSFVMFTVIFVMIPRATVSAKRINEVLELEPTIIDGTEKAMLEEPIDSIEFKHVTFYYPGAEKPALKNISFTAKRGETTAIIGGTGDGKTTLLQLIPRFYDPDEGALFFNDVPITQISQQILREKIGYVPQKAILFTGTIAENIRYGNETATDEEVKHAATVAQATPFIEEIDGGFDAFVEQGGKNLSGGQKQRLSIARALVRRADVYLFDDSFSALDYKTDALLRKALKNETEDAITIVVAQRISTVKDADQIIVLHEGKIVGIGTHEQLIKTNDIYQEIVSSQVKGGQL